MTLPEQLERLARDLPALEYSRNAWLAISRQFHGPVGTDAAEHVVRCIEDLRVENAALRKLVPVLCSFAKAAPTNDASRVVRDRAILEARRFGNAQWPDPADRPTPQQMRESDGKVGIEHPQVRGDEWIGTAPPA